MTFPNICPKIHTWLNYPLKILKDYFQSIKMVFGEHKLNVCDREKLLYIGDVNAMCSALWICISWYWTITGSLLSLKCFFIIAAEVQGTTLLVKWALQNHRRYNCSLTCRFCHWRVFLFLTKLFWTYSGPNHVLDIPTEGVTLISIMTHFKNMRKNALLFLLQSHCTLKLDKGPGSIKLLCKKYRGTWQTKRKFLCKDSKSSWNFGDGLCFMTFSVAQIEAGN